MVLILKEYNTTFGREKKGYFKIKPLIINISFFYKFNRYTIQQNKKNCIIIKKMMYIKLA